MDRTTRRLLWIVGATLMLLDGLTTWAALTLITNAREANPLGVWAIDNLTLAGMCAVKVLIGVVMVWRLAAVSEHGHRYDWMNRNLIFRRIPIDKVKRGAGRSLIFTVVLMSFVVTNNAIIIATH